MSLAKWLKEKVKQHPQLNLLSRLLMRHIRAHTSAYPDWRKITGYGSLGIPNCGKRVLIATSVGSHLPATTLESLLAAALKVRGAEVHVFLCDAALPACLGCENEWFPDAQNFAKNGPKSMLCGTCFSPARKMFENIGVQVHRYSDYLTSEDKWRAEELATSISYALIQTYKLDDIAVGEHAFAGALRFYAKATIDDEPTAEAIVRRYFQSAMLSTFATRNLLRAIKFDVAAFHHGIYVPQGLISEVAKAASVRVVTWNPAYRKQSFIFSHKDTYHHTLMSEPVDKWTNMTWSPSHDTAIMDYLKSRWDGSQDWIWFHDRPNFEVDGIVTELGFDRSKPCVGMLTNVMWDAQLHYPANAFPNMLEWVIETIEYFKGRLDLQLIIRVHPAEIRGTLKSRQPIVEEIHKRYNELPKNIFLIGPESDISTYTLVGLCDSVIIYGTKTGVELTSMGIPTIVAGEAWIRNKGLTFDVKTREDYVARLDQLPFNRRMLETQIVLARKYAFHFFFRRMIPICLTIPVSGWPPYKLDVTSWDQLAEGKSKGLDIVCDGILYGRDFIYPAEHLMAN